MGAGKLSNLTGFWDLQLVSSVSSLCVCQAREGSVFVANFVMLKCICCLGSLLRVSECTLANFPERGPI